MKKEKPTTKTCKHCKTEMPIDEKVCPNCGKKQPNGCLIAIIALVVVIVILALPFGGSDAQKNLIPNQPRLLKQIQKHPAKTISKKLLKKIALSLI